jgi:amidase
MPASLTSEPGAIATAAMIARGDLSPLEAVDAAIARIEALDGPINAVVVRDFDRARDTARAMTGSSPSPGQPLYGVPITVKEAFNVAGLPTTRGRSEHTGFVPTHDAEVVARLKATGAIVLGKTNVPVDLKDLQCENPVYGRTHNPYLHDHSPGGSSGGSAAALAAGMVPAEFGSDTGGSIRVPAHFCGIWGHRPSLGLVSDEGHQAPGKGWFPGQLTVAGPMAREADDLGLLLRLTAERALTRRDRPLEAWRVLWLGQHPASTAAREVLDPAEAVVAALENRGARVDPASEHLPDLAADHRSYMRMMGIELDGGAPSRDGRVASAADWFALCSAQASARRGWARLFEHYDFVLAPPAPFAAHPYDPRPIAQRTVPFDGAEHPYGEVFAWAGLVAFPGLPATVLPIGANCPKPVGLQVIGPAFGDLDTIAAAGAIAQLIG